jgi:hypothetical protein
MMPAATQSPAQPRRAIARVRPRQIPILLADVPSIKSTRGAAPAARRAPGLYAKLAAREPCPAAPPPADNHVAGPLAMHNRIGYTRPSGEVAAPAQSGHGAALRLTRPVICGHHRISKWIFEMPVFQKENISILFVHIPKAAGTTIENFFRQQEWNVSFFDGGEDKPTINTVSWCSPQHFHAEILTKVFNIRKFSFCFTIVRDPISRIKSEVRWRKQYFNQNLEPEQWIYDALQAYPRNPFVHDNHIRPQSEFLFDGLEVYNLEDGLEPVMAQLTSRFADHLAPSPTVARVMTSEESGYEIDLSENLLTKLKAFYAVDYHKLCFFR